MTPRKLAVPYLSCCNFIAIIASHKRAIRWSALRTEGWCYPGAPPERSADMCRASFIEATNASALLQVRMMRQLGDAGGVVFVEEYDQMKRFCPPPFQTGGPNHAQANLLFLNSCRIAERNQAADWHTESRRLEAIVFYGHGVAIRYGRVLPLNLGALMPFRPLSEGCP